MRTTDPPRAAKERIISSSSSASAGARTAVGSSSRRIRASPARALTISSRCLSDTESRPARWSGSSGSPIRSLSERVRSRISCGTAGHPAASATFSATVSAGTDVKC